MVLITCGLWLFVIPLYPARCMTCGMTRGAAIFSSMPKWARSVGILVFLAIVCVVVINVSQSDQSQSASLTKGPDYNEVPTPAKKVAKSRLAERIPTPTESTPEPAVAPAPETTPVAAPTPILATTSDDSESHKFREDGRVYGVGLIAATDLSMGAVVLAQGRVASFGYAGMRSRPFAVIGDEQHPSKTLLCAMMADEGAEVVSLYHVGEVVRVSGDYMGTLPLAGNPSMPTLSNCQVAGPQNNIVRAAEDAQ